MKILSKIFIIRPQICYWFAPIDHNFLNRVTRHRQFTNDFWDGFAVTL